ncbi:hypothetical protein AFE_3007 [Acidithiobacillus ferrooxidans ATCC 23270]|uniref:Uncharacterized protein n=1 Tax=Acidithiobacillus ferrooxidans (strain ATCC 23270 / DSM 14882 / CIP 104768 / NCIMB 8455) TaxID=243159 RepID=B7J9Y0_ACIF2|nr:hypothetical protein AFE_3007 [Acidithiobacillus ferrooxidans ATCC 23270]
MFALSIVAKFISPFDGRHDPLLFFGGSACRPFARRLGSRKNSARKSASWFAAKAASVRLYSCSNRKGLRVMT